MHNISSEGKKTRFQSRGQHHGSDRQNTGSSMNRILKLWAKRPLPPLFLVSYIFTEMRKMSNITCLLERSGGKREAEARAQGTLWLPVLSFFPFQVPHFLAMLWVRGTKTGAVPCILTPQARESCNDCWLNWWSRCFSGTAFHCRTNQSKWAYHLNAPCCFGPQLGEPDTCDHKGPLSCNAKA